ncbi:MAG: hypothetical protein K2X66_03090, partial [Cyanobacteria bacterium]|nr:hypothetical protein [Cyanobacteriota bacterium]
ENLPSPDIIEFLYQEAIRDTPNNGRIYLAMARYYSKQPDASESALRAYWQALKGTSFKDQVPLKREFLDYLKSGKVSPPAAEKTFQELITESPTDTWIKGAYAEFLSYQPPRRPEAIKLYLNLIAEEPGDKDKWRMPLERVIGWMKPSVEMIPTYQEVLKLYPDSKEGQLALARAYQLQPETKMASLQLYQQLVKAYPEDQKIKKEWAGALLGDEAHRREALAILRKLVEENPNDLSIKIAYAKLLSYDQKYGRALELFDEVLAQEPDNRDALLGKAYTLMFDYQRYKALGMFEQLRKAYPEDIEVALGLAEAERAIGRYDKALRLIKEIKPLLNWDFEGVPGVMPTPNHGIQKTTAILVDYETPYQPTFGRGNGLDYSVMPFAETVVPDSSLGKQYLGGSYATSTPGASSRRKSNPQKIQVEDENEYQGADVERAPSQSYPDPSSQRQMAKNPERDFYMEGEETASRPKRSLPFWSRKKEIQGQSGDSEPIISAPKISRSVPLPSSHQSITSSSPQRAFAPPPSLRDLRMMEAASDSDTRRSSRPSKIVDPSNERVGEKEDSQEVYVNVSTVDPIDRTLIEKGAGAPGFEMLGSGSTPSPHSTEISPDAMESPPTSGPSRNASGDGSRNSQDSAVPGSVENNPENASTQEGPAAERSPQPVSESGDDLAQGGSANPGEYQDPSLEPSATPQPKRTGRTASMNKELDDVNSAIETIRAIQKNSTNQIHTMHNTLAGSKENDLGAVDGLENEDDRSTLKAFGQYAAIDQDTNPLITQLGRFKTESKNLETRIGKELRPMARAGYAYMVQDGEKSTVRLRGWSIPNQMSLSLTPQLRIRGGITPAMVAQPRVSTSPRSNTYQTYSMGLTAKYWDHFTVDGDLAIIDFNTTDNANITYQANGKYDFNDKISLRVGGRRFQNQNSLLSFAGYRPLRGPFKDTLVGQAMENAVFVELNTLPFRNTDFNLGYEFAHVTGHEIKSNNRNQAFLSVGYTQPYLKHHYARLGYELLYFGYSEPATLGYFNLRSTGPNTPLATINPINLAPSASVFGGYFSPKYFFLNSLRADLRGSFFNKFLEYRLGGGVGIQTFSNGSGIFTQTPSAFACNADANVIMNFTDWLSGYLHGEFIKGGGAFNRVRFGGGVIVRPNIPALSPVFGKI